MAFVEKSKRKYATEIESHIINLLDHQDNPDLLNLNKVHKDNFALPRCFLFLNNK